MGRTLVAGEFRSILLRSLEVVYCIRNQKPIIETPHNDVMCLEEYLCHTHTVCKESCFVREQFLSSRMANRNFAIR